jgi:glycosyltransferase involved in cell wall biosynthesis
MPLYAGDDPGALEDAFKSILVEQDFLPSQVVVVVDGPISLSLNEILLRWKVSFEVIDVVQVEENVGISLALNSGLKFCRNEIVFRMDADDISNRQRFRKQYDYMVENPQIAMCSAWVEQYDFAMKSIVGVRNVPSTPAGVARFAKRRTPINHMALCFRKSLIESVGAYPDTRFPFEDWWLCLRVLRSGNYIGNIDEYLVKVRTGENFYKRRSGLAYAKSEIKAVLQMRREGLLTAVDVLANLAIRTPARLLPVSLLAALYQKILVKN